MLFRSLSLHAGTIADGLSRRRRFAVAVVLALALALLPRLDRPPAAHPEAIEIVGRGVSDLLERSRSGVVIIDLLDDEALAVRTLSGDPDRAILAGEDVSVRRWRAGTNNAGVRVSAGILIARPDVLGLVTTREIATGDTRILAHSGEYVLLGR